MAKTSGIAAEQAQQAVDQVSETLPQESNVSDNSDIAEGIQDTGNAGFPQNIQYDTGSQGFAAPQQQSAGQQQAQLQQQQQQRFPSNPMTVAADVAATLGAVSPQQRVVDYSPLQSIPTVSQARQRSAAQSEARDIKREAVASNQIDEAVQLASEMQGPVRTQEQREKQEQERVAESNASENRQTYASNERTKIDDRISQERGSRATGVISFGVTEKPVRRNPVGFINRMFKGAGERAVETARRKLKSFSPAGNSFNAEMLGDANVPPHCVSIGSENLIEAIREPGSRIIELVNESTGDNLTLEECLADITLLVDAINSAEIEVVLEKSPDNRRDSIQVRTLKAHIGVNIRVHPTQLKGYNADFDGDTGKLMFDQRLINRYERAMSMLIGIDGKPNIDSDFFPLDEVKGTRQQILDLMLEKDFNWNELIARRIVDDYITLVNSQSSKELSSNWVKLLRTIDDVCNNMSKNAKDRQKLISRTFSSLYNFGRRRRLIDLEIVSSNQDFYEQFSNFDPPPAGTDPFVVAMVDIQDGVIAGRPAPNMQEFAKMYSRFTGEPLDKDGMPTNKNVPFRLVADFGKAIKRSEFILIGDSTPVRVDSGLKYIPFETLYQITCSAAVTKQISGRMHMGSHELRASTQLRDIMLREVGLPKQGESFNSFVKRFRDEYNYHVRLLEIAKHTRFRADMRISRDFGWDGITEIKKIGKAFLDIYGDFTVQQMFPNITRLEYGVPESELRKRGTSVGVLSKYHDMTLNQFVMSNKLDIDMDEIQSHFSNGSWGEMDILLLIADRRRADTQSYKETWEQWTEKMFDIIPDIQRAIANQDYNRYSRGLLELMHLASPNMFGYFGMDDFQSFIKSEWGQKLLLSDSVDLFRSTWVSMMIEYRMGKAMKIHAEKAEVSALAMETDDREKVIDAIDAAYDSELSVIASSSFAWKAIIEESREGNPNFRMLLESASDTYRANGSDWVLNASRFWKDPGSKQYRSLYAFLKSDVSYEDKMSVLSDITRIRENYKEIMSFEMIGQLAHHPGRIYEGSQFDMSSGLDTKPFKASMDGVSSMMSARPRKARKFARQLAEEARKNPAVFEFFINKLATDPGFLVSIDPVLAADVMASVADKDYSDTEKIKQQRRANGYFQSASKMRAGGMYTHIQQTDNKQFNVIGYDQLTPIDLIRIIGTNQTYYVYDEFGRIAPISRETICGGTSTEAVIRYFEDNPQMAYIFRRYSANINDDTGRGAKTPGTASLRGIDNSYSLFASCGDPRTVEQKAFQLLCDRPRFFALVALLTPVNLDTGRTLSGKYNDGINAMCNMLAYLAKFDGETTPESMASNFEKITGLSEEKILEATKVAKFDDGSGFDEEQARLMYAEAIGEMQECVSILAENGLIFDQAYSSPRTYKWGIDNNSVTSYYDVRQQFSGCRTATMISVEGSETNRNQMLKLYLNHRPDRFFTVDLNTSESEVAELSKLLKRDLRSELEQTGRPILIDRNAYPELAGWIPSDPTLERSKGRQLSSTARYIEIKRDSAAEEFNAKTKKFGDDGTNSITKFDKFDYDAARKLRSDILTTSANRDEAIYLLAEALHKADVDLGYKTFPMSDYLNRADLMIVEDNGALVIRTMEQLAVACRNRLSMETRYSGDNDRIMAELQQIVETLGTSMDTVQASSDDIIYDVVSGVQRLGSGGSFKSDRAVLERASSIERNYSLLRKFYNEFASTYVAPNGVRFVSVDRDNLGENEERFVPPSRSAVEKMSFKAFKKLKAKSPIIADKIRGLAFPYMQVDENTGNKKERAVGNRENVYDFLGEAGDRELVLQPGPQNLVLFTSENQKVLDQCRQYGITALFSNFNVLPEDLQADAQEVGNGMYIVPFFYMALNGATGDQLGPAPAQYQYHPTNFTVCVEDYTGEICAGDATAHVTKELGDRTQVVWGNTESFSAEELFPNVMEAFSGENYDYQVDFCSREEVQKYIINQFDDATIDIGISPDNPMFAHEVAKMETRITEYASRFGEVNSVSFIEGQMKDDRIVGFVKIIVNGHIRAFAPIIPFNRNKSGTVPRNYKIASLGYDDATKSFKMAWRYEGDIRGQSVKFFEGIGASNKMMTNGDFIRSRSLANGLPVDVMYSTKSVASRMFASNKRINTLITLMMMPRVDLRYAYNFGDLSDSFPGNDDFREALKNDQLTKAQWADFYRSGQKFHSDEEIDSVVRFIVGRCVEYGTVNPTTILANKFADGSVKLLVTEFEAFMDTSINFQNGLMKLMHSMNPSLCPPNIQASSESTLFKPNIGKGDQYGVLQMLVPHYMSDTDTDPFYVKENVYISPGFFGDVFSGFGRFNVSASIANEDLVVANSLSDEMLMQYAAIGASEFSPIDQMLMRGVSLTPDSVMVDTFAEALRKKRELGDEWGRVLSLTGHRPNKDPEKDKLWGFDMNHPNYQLVKQQLKAFCEANGIDTIVSGMAIGFDQLGAEVALEMGLKLVAAVPFKGQESKWPKQSQDRYNSILERADKVIYVSEPGYSSKKMQIRNEWMVDNCDIVAALWDGSSGGTANCVDYAIDMYANIARLDPKGDLSDGFRLYRGELDPMVEVSQQEDVIDDVERIDSFRGKYDFLSNMFDAPIEYDGFVFQNAEAAFQAQKVDYQRSYISHYPEDFENLSGKEAKQLGRQLSIDVKLWNEERYDTMKEIVLSKFKQNPELANKLMETGKAELIEGNTWGDTYWGVSDGTGENNLGKILMEVRDELRKAGD